VTVLVGAIAAVAGALAAGLANAYAARQRVKEIEVSYLQRLKDGYLENARKVTAQVYIPLSVALTSLANSYDRFSGWIDYQEQISAENFKEDFLTECLQYLATVDELMKRGADAYLTTALDEELQSFTNFIRDSMDAQELHRKRVMRALVTTEGLRFIFFGLPYIRYQFELAEKAAGKLRLPAFDVGLFGLKLAYSERIYSAKIESREFEARIRGTIPALKALIKEVTLGAPAAS
jgi:hypothetical protein